jgi:hypothetical protein
MEALSTGHQNEFEQKILERLRNDIRELLPEAALRRLVERAVDETFFKERRIDRGYGNVDVKPSWFVEEIAKTAKPLVQAAVDRFVDERHDLIQQAIDRFVTEQQLTIQLSTRLASMLNDTFGSALNRARDGRF